MHTLQTVLFKQAFRSWWAVREEIVDFPSFGKQASVFATYLTITDFVKLGDIVTRNKNPDPQIYWLSRIGIFVSCPIRHKLGHHQLEFLDGIFSIL